MANAPRSQPGHQIAKLIGLVLIGTVLVCGLIGSCLFVATFFLQ